MKIKVSYLDILDVKNQEEAYDSLLKYCGEVVESGDVSAFCFEEVEGNRLSEAELPPALLAYFKEIADAEEVLRQARLAAFGLCGHHPWENPAVPVEEEEES